MKHKVLAYVTRRNNNRFQLLVFDHRDFPAAGTQVPAGTVEAGETAEDAVLREIEEEAGLELPQLRLVSKLATDESSHSQTVRQVFHLSVGPTELPSSWIHTVRSGGEDNGLVFIYRWIELPIQVELAGGQGQWLHLIDLPL